MLGELEQRFNRGVHEEPPPSALAVLANQFRSPLIYILLVAGAADEEQLRLTRELNLRSAVSVPLIAHGKVLGVMTWVSADAFGPAALDDFAPDDDARHDA